MQPASLKDGVECGGVFPFSHAEMKLQHQLSCGLEVAIIILMGWLLDMIFFFGPSGGSNFILILKATRVSLKGEAVATQY